ncbi:DUF4132 domain-containing protein [Actinoplanes sp. NPDC051861]|uniref:DUF4132 domain-containing protein n=1 Tax=Actinoplanes sp. NPDC051861 TaxID=3155170 RepID=UPI00342B9FA1
MAAGNGRGPGVVHGLVCADETVMAWADGEREHWLSRAAAIDHGREEAGWGKAATGADRLSDLSPMQISWLFVKGPEASARALLQKPRVLRHRQRIDVGRVAVARFERDALVFVLEEVGEDADGLGLLMLPFRGPEPARVIAGWLRHLGSARLWARLWLQRHPEAAARALIPAAVGKPSRVRQNAEEALRHLAAIGHGPILIKTARGYGESALAAVGALFGVPPGEELTPESVLSLVPSKKAKASQWSPPAMLPELRLAGGGPMAESDVARLIDGLMRLRLEDPPEPAPGDLHPPGSDLPLAVPSAEAAQPLVAPLDPETEKLIARSDPASRAEYGRALLDAWLSADMPAAEAWVVLAQAYLGDDATMDRFEPLLRSWPAKSRYARAIDGYAMLSTVASDVALRHLLAIEERMSGGATNDRVLDYLTRASARRGRTVTELADRLAITHGLDAGLTLDYGPRRFAVGTDDHLTPHVVGADGRILARPPRPGVRDTNPGAYQWFLQLKKDLRATAAAQIARFEREMLAHRLRPAWHLAEVVLPHPILGRITRRLLWGEYDGSGNLIRALRIAEDGTFADIDDAVAVVDGAAQLGIVHPALLGADLPEWAQIFGDYEILQPFPQVHRPAVVLTEAERAATSLPGFGPVTPDQLAQPRNRGWEGNGYHDSSYVHTQLTYRLGDTTVIAELEPGLPTSTYNVTLTDQRISEIWVDDSRSDHWQRARVTPMGACDPAALSEALVELYAIRG